MGKLLEKLGQVHEDFHAFITGEQERRTRVRAAGQRKRAGRGTTVAPKKRKQGVQV